MIMMLMISCYFTLKCRTLNEKIIIIIIKLFKFSPSGNIFWSITTFCFVIENFSCGT